MLLSSNHPFPAAVLPNSLPAADESRCTLIFEESEQWFRATWRGYIDPAEAMRGATTYLNLAMDIPCSCLLNDNSALQGPWFDTVEWLERAWLPHAHRLGLRYIAHVVQADTHTDILTLSFPSSIRGQVELQLFHHVAEAEEWLRTCQQRANSLPAQ